MHQTIDYLIYYFFQHFVVTKDFDAIMAGAFFWNYGATDILIVATERMSKIVVSSTFFV